MAVPLAFVALLAIWPLGWKSTGRSLSGDQPWPDDLEPAGDFQITCDPIRALRSGEPVVGQLEQT
jgi:hypothetical protein